MRIPTYLVKSKTGVYHFRLMVPHALRHALGRVVFKRSLRTRDPQKAQLLALSLALRYAQSLGESGGCVGKKFIDLDFSGRGVDRISKWEAELPNGIRIRTTNDSMEDHLAALSAVEVASKYLATREIVPTYTAPKKRLDEAAKEFLASIEVGEPNAKTLGQKKLSVNGFTKWKGPATDIATLVPKDFQDFSVYLKNVEELALPTISNRLIYIRQWMAWAQTMRYYPSGENPANGVAIYGKKSKNERAKKNGWQAFSDDQIQQLFNPQIMAETCA